MEKVHTISMSNCYNNVQLATSLYKDKTHVRKNPKSSPKFAIEKKLKKGESILARSSNGLVQKWQDKRHVLTPSVKHKASEVGN